MTRGLRGCVICILLGCRGAVSKTGLGWSNSSREILVSRGCRWVRCCCMKALRAVSPRVFISGLWMVWGVRETRRIAKLRAVWIIGF